MGYFLEYEHFTPCWFCGRTECTGNHPNNPEAEKQLNRITHFDKGCGHSSCDCQVCKYMRSKNI